MPNAVNAQSWYKSTHKPEKSKLILTDFMKNSQNKKLPNIVKYLCCTNSALLIYNSLFLLEILQSIQDTYHWLWLRQEKSNPVKIADSKTPCEHILSPNWWSSWKHCVWIVSAATDFHLDVGILHPHRSLPVTSSYFPFLLMKRIKAFLRGS